jgi:wyosine [tRNA(Phe)-imidazoG37] synthetase (radical SAM superfamily)
MDSILDERQERFLSWLLTPAGHRTPTSQDKLATELGVDETTLRRWKKKPAFKLEWEKRVNELQQSPERTQKLLDSLYERAMNGDNNSAKLYLQATNRLAPTQVHVEHSTKPSDISDAELDALIAAAAQSEAESRRELKPL